MSDYVLALSEAELKRYQMMAEHAHALEAAQWARAGIAEAASVADVGCGPGAMSTLLAKLVGPGGRVWAVDQDAGAVAAATALAGQLGLDNVRCRVGLATDTGLDPGSVDVVMMRHVLAHNGGREQAIVDHLATLVRPGGCVYLLDIDVAAFRTRPAVAEFDELNQRYWDFHAARGNDLQVGLRLAELLTTAGLQLVEHRGWFDIFVPQPGLRPPPWVARNLMVDAGFATQDDLQRWGAFFDRFDRGEQSYTLFVPQFSAIGRRPEPSG